MTQTHPPSHNKTQELSSLYQEVIIDHFKNPRYKGRIQDCLFCQEGKNPLCGDVVSVYCKILPECNLFVANGRKCILQVHFDGTGCSISQASASIMCELVQNKSVQDTKIAIKHAEQIYTGKQEVNADNMDSDMDALHGVGQFPARIKCAALPWKTLECLIEENFDSNGNPLSRTCEKHLKSMPQGRKLKIISTEI